MDTIVQKIIEWGKQESDVQVIILEGSRGANRLTDALSDYDINVFCTNSSGFQETDSWTGHFGELLFCQHTSFNAGSHIIPARLALFQSGLKIDFSFWPLPLISEFIYRDFLPESYRNGYDVLVDKSAATSGLREPDRQGFKIGLPSQELFIQYLDNFWFESFCIAKNLKRGYLFAAMRLLFGPILDFFTTMMIWRKLIEDHQTLCENFNIKKIELFFNPEDVSEWMDSAVRYDRETLWERLFHLYRIHRESARLVAGELSLKYAYKKDLAIFKMILELRNA